MKPLSVPERLAKNRFLLDEEQCHIEVNQEIAKATGTGKLLVACCPAHVYAEEADGTISVEYAACLECGTCLAIAAPGALAGTRWGTNKLSAAAKATIFDSTFSANGTGAEG